MIIQKFPKKFLLTIFIVIMISIVYLFSNIFQQKAFTSSTLLAGQKSNKIKNLPLPSGYDRIKYHKGSYQNWIRNIRLKKPGSPVLLFNGNHKGRQDVHHSILKIDVGNYDLQQCADAVMRIRAEYLYSQKRYREIHFNFTSGHTIYFYKWALGYRPLVRGNNVFIRKRAARDFSYRNFRRYLIRIYQYAGSMSLSRELVRVRNINSIRIGDVFIKGGFPGHAVLVVDTAKNRNTGKKIFLLAQSYMPAQDIHILKNFHNSTLSPWYSVDFGKILKTPEWKFSRSQLKRFK